MPKKISKNKSKVATRDKALPHLPQGFYDIWVGDVFLWDRLISVGRDTAEFYNFSYLQTPILERASIISNFFEDEESFDKEIFTLKGGGTDKLVLRPNLTAGLLRAYIEHSLNRIQPQKLYNIGPVFNKSHYADKNTRQFYHFEAQIIGESYDPVYDSQVINMFYRFLEELKIKNLMIHINSIGCHTCQPLYIKKLLNHYKGAEPCKECKRFMDLNPLYLLQCVDKNCEGIKSSAPSIFDNLCSGCSKHLKQVLEFLDELKLPYTMDANLVHLYPYYERVLFDIVVDGENKESLVKGGRYDHLMQELGGSATPAVGGSADMFNIIRSLKKDNPQPRMKNRVFMIHIGELAKRRSMVLIEEFRKNNINIVESLGKDSLSAQLEIASKSGAQVSLIFGQKEAYEESIILRDTQTGVQESIPLQKIVETVKKRLR